MMKCDHCYDRTSIGLATMCASVCPSQALFFGTRQEIEQLRPGSRPMDTWQFGEQVIRTKVNVMVPKRVRADRVDVTSAMQEDAIGNHVEDDLLLAAAGGEEER